ncbi:hypothetical protein CONPUDRAFT_114263 [Coniophora puteana RWD-64-598 SS2]|uniref:Family A G protein-coupled receptor-like protein n=1 Tax=Coniophora puteana (strain RWD-64-598) TaxID=741705 RepID=A0A5M3N4E6_CONPW|nr:uncharacterized protein CONPUDRAFT_114263 [Coniophora puteana RWD-64-598 SS2]EIW86127.1 hypothetical protein CONPUDRAFT_114263 [Coniophora puteana RWD-64-598 SS2]
MTSTTSTQQVPDLAAAQFAASLQIIGTMTVGGVFYGFMTVTAAMCFWSLLQTRQRWSSRQLALLLAYVGALWAAGTVMMGGISQGSINTFVYNGARALESPYAQAPAVGSTTLVVDTTWWIVRLLTDGMMLWRFKVIWSTSRLWRYLIVAPVLFYLSAALCGFLAAIVFSRRSVFNASDTTTHDLITSMFITSFALNLYVTVLVAGRLFAYRRRFRANWGSPHTKHYTSMGAMLVESYLILALFTIAFVVTYLLNSPAQYMAATVFGQMQITAPLLVMLRVSRGVAWGSTTPASVGSVVDRALGAHDLRGAQVGAS